MNKSWSEIDRSENHFFWSEQSLQSSDSEGERKSTKSGPEARHIRLGKGTKRPVFLRKRRHLSIEKVESAQMDLKMLELMNFTKKNRKDLMKFNLDFFHSNDQEQSSASSVKSSHFNFDSSAPKKPCEYFSNLITLFKIRDSDKSENSQKNRHSKKVAKRSFLRRFRKIKRALPGAKESGDNSIESIPMETEENQTLNAIGQDFSSGDSDNKSRTPENVSVSQIEGSETFEKENCQRNINLCTLDDNKNSG